jgi:hypothetical protein
MAKHAVLLVDQFCDAGSANAPPAAGSRTTTAAQPMHRETVSSIR